MKDTINHSMPIPVIVNGSDGNTRKTSGSAHVMARYKAINAYGMFRRLVVARGLEAVNLTVIGASDGGGAFGMATLCFNLPSIIDQTNGAFVVNYNIYMSVHVIVGVEIVYI